jgi:hypothetical protein
MVPYILVIYVFDCKSEEMHTDFLCILHYIMLAVYVSGVICAHHQEHKLQSTAVGTCWKLDSTLEQVADGPPSHSHSHLHSQHSQFRSKT